MPSIKLQSSDGQNFDVDVEIARCSFTIRTMLENLGTEGGDDEAIPLPKVNSLILGKVLEWATQHKDDEQPSNEDKTERKTEEIGEWDAQFVAQIDKGTLFELILAANYLDIKGLLDITAKTVANMIKDKTPEEIRATFSLKNDLSPSEIAQIKKENEWCGEQ